MKIRELAYGYTRATLHSAEIKFSSFYVSTIPLARLCSTRSSTNAPWNNTGGIVSKEPEEH